MRAYWTTQSGQYLIKWSGKLESGTEQSSYENYASYDSMESSIRWLDKIKYWWSLIRKMKGECWVASLKKWLLQCIYGWIVGRFEVWKREVECHGRKTSATDQPNSSRLDGEANLCVETLVICDRNRMMILWFLTLVRISWDNFI